MLNEQLISELPQLLDLRIPYFDPSFEAMIRIQCKFAEEGYEKLGGVQRSVSLLALVRCAYCLAGGRALSWVCRYFSHSVREDYAAGQLDAQVRTAFLLPPAIEHATDRDNTRRLRTSCRRCGSSLSAAPAKRIISRM